jgi:hypothetical protein
MDCNHLHCRNVAVDAGFVSLIHYLTIGTYRLSYLRVQAKARRGTSAVRCLLPATAALMLVALSASFPAAAVRAVATPRGGHQPHASSERAAVYDIGDLDVAAPETLTRRSRRRRRRRVDDERPMTSTAIVLARPSLPPPIPPPVAEDNPLRHVVDARALWEMIEPHSQHLADEDCAHLKASIDVLLAKLATALAHSPACGSPRAPRPAPQPVQPTLSPRRRRLPPGRRSRRPRP